MSTTLTALAAMTDAQERGYAFERYLADLLRREQFEVITRTAPANGRQVDLIASRGDRHYLVETKWRKAKAGVPEVDELLRRLDRGVPNVVGVLVSWSGFTRPAIARVEQDATRPVLLVTGPELVGCEATGGLPRLLASKHHRLIAYGQADVADSPAAKFGSSTPLPPSQGRYVFVTKDQRRLPVLEFAGGFGPVVFCLDLPDLDRGDGHGVAVEFALNVSDLAGLKLVFERLSERGWITRAGSWRIHQQGATWNGFGLDALLDALADPDSRYADRLMHHSEALTYVDAAGHGLYCLTAQVGRTRIDQVSMVTVSFRLPGVPLDPSSLQTLVRGLQVETELYFRPLNRPVAERVRLPSWVASRRLKAEALIVGNPPMLVSDGDGDGDGGQEWVLGVVVKNPFTRSLIPGWHASPAEPEMLAELGRDNDFLVCTLGAWHYAGESRDYVIDFIETAWVDDRLLTRVHLDWFDEAAAERRRRPRGVTDWVGEHVNRALFSAGVRLQDRFERRRVRMVRVENPPD